MFPFLDRAVTFFATISIASTPMHTATIAPPQIKGMIIWPVPISEASAFGSGGRVFLQEEESYNKKGRNQLVCTKCYYVD